MIDYNKIDTVDKDYYNLDDIMSTKTTVACRFGSETPSSKRFYFFFSSLMNNIVILVVFQLMGQKPPEVISTKGFKTETPVWLASFLCTKKQQFDAEVSIYLI